MPQKIIQRTLLAVAVAVASQAALAGTAYTGMEGFELPAYDGGPESWGGAPDAGGEPSGPVIGDGSTDEPTGGGEPSGPVIGDGSTDETTGGGEPSGPVIGDGGTDETTTPSFVNLSGDIQMTGRNTGLEFKDEVGSFSLLGSALIEGDIVRMSASTVTGDVNNKSELTATGTSVAGFDIDGGALGSRTAFKGNLINSGSLKLLGAGSSGILMDNVDMFGSVSNTGTITIEGGYNQDQAQGGSGIRLFDVNAIGDIRNDGKISVTGARSNGLSFNQSQLAGYLINSNMAAIKVDGDDSNGISAYKTKMEMTFNYGVVSASGAGANAIDFDQSTIRALVNAGTIEGKGADSKGILFDGVTFLRNNDYTIAQHGIINSGVIKGEKYGIQVDGALNGSQPLYVNLNGGVISGGKAAIIGNDNIFLNWKNGLVNGDLVGLSEVNVNGYSTFNGAKISGRKNSSVNVNNGARLSFEQLTTSIDGNLNVMNGGAIRLLVSNDSNPLNPILTVSGDANFEENTTVYLAPSPQDFAPQSEGINYSLIEASKITNLGLKVESQSSLLEVKEFSTLGGSLYAKLAMRDFKQIADDIFIPVDKEDPIINKAPIINNPPLIIIQRPVDTPDPIFYSAAQVRLISNLSFMLPDDPIYKAFVKSDSAQLRGFAASLLPQVNTSTISSSYTSTVLISSAISTRVTSFGLPSTSSGDALSETGVWFQTLNNDATQDSTSDQIGYTADTSGFILGADGKTKSGIVAGVAFSQINSDIKSYSANTTEVTGYSVTGYTGFTPGNWLTNATLSYSKNDNDTTRYIAGTAAKGNYDSSMMGATIESGYSFDVTPAIQLTPLTALRYAAIDIDSYRESGSSASLRIGSQRYEIAEAGLGLRADTTLPVGKGILKPEAKVMSYHDFIGDKANVTSSFVLGGSPFTTAGASPERDTYQAGVGAVYEMGNLSLGLNYDYTAKSNFNSDTVTTRLRYDF